MLAATADAFRRAAPPQPQPAALPASDERRHEGDIAKLVQAARRNDRAAFARLHERFAPMVHGIVLARASRSEAQDLVQQTFLEAMQKLKSLRDAEAFGAWIASIARNLATQCMRDRARMRLTALPNQPSEQTNRALDDAERILRIIQSLPDAYAETLTLRLVEGMTGPQIAACTGLTEGSVRVNLHRGMELLRQKLGLEGER
jgi:RNA polymerase sigma-70 factor, ECF subfamily